MLAAVAADRQGRFGHDGTASSHDDSCISILLAASQAGANWPNGAHDPWRLLAKLILLRGAVALLVSLAGIYSVMSFTIPVAAARSGSELL